MRKEKEFNRSDYDYLDRLPLEGWIWEFIRRNESYRKHFSLQKKDATYPFDCYDLYGLIPYRFYTYPAKNIDHKNFLLITRQLKGKEISAITLYEYFPNPEKRYCDFGIHKPLIRGLLNVKIHDLGNDPFRPDIDCNNPEYQKYCCTVVTNYLAIEDDPRSTLYLGISKNAKREELEERIKTILKQYIKTKRDKSRIRNKEWGKYLMVYDYKKNNPGILFRKICDYLNLNCNWAVDEKTLSTYYKKASDLISDKYKEYLFSIPR
jgi:hypothetical protein